MAAIKRKQEKSVPKDRKKPKVDSKTPAVKKAAPAASPKNAKKPAVIEKEEEETEDSDDELDDDDEEEFHGNSADDDEDEEGEDEQDANGDKPIKDATVPTGKTTEEIAKARASRAEQKRLIAERKQAKPMGNVIYKSKKIWEQIRRKDLSSEERKKKIEEHQTMIRGQIKDLVFKHDASRVVQTALKYGSKSVREEVAKELKGTYVDLAQNSYGKYLVVKIMHYGTPETRKMVVEEFCGHVKKLIKHREASFVIEDCFREFGTPEQKARMVREFYGAEFALFGGKDGGDADPSLKKILEKSPEKRAVIMKNIFELLTAVVEKGAVFFTIVHKAMLEYILNTTPGTTGATEFIELVKEHTAAIAFSKDGAQVVMRCLALGNAKDRKVIIKSLKGVANDLAIHESGHLVLLTLMDVVDDTVLVNKSIFSELQPNVLDLAVHKFGRIPLLYPFVGRKNRLLPPPTTNSIQEMDKIREATSKKDPEVRQTELRNHLSPIVLQGVVDYAADLVHDSFGCQFIIEVLLGASVTDLATGNPNTESHVASTAAGGRMLKTLVAGGHYNNKERKVELIDPPLNFHTVLYGRIKGNIQEWATGAGSFVVVSLLETTGFTKVEELKGGLKKHLNAIKEAAEKENKGSKVIVEKL
ncbi:armadillo-type protein [Trichophaea hybrida]|nr:armadillo-type protein [Trichophaea hybrida]